MDLAKINEIAGVVSCVVGVISLIYTLAQKNTNRIGTRNTLPLPKTTDTTLSDLRRRHSNSDATAIKKMEWSNEEEETYYEKNSGVDDEERWQALGFIIGICGIVGAGIGWHYGYEIGSISGLTGFNKILNSPPFNETIGTLLGAGAGAILSFILGIPWCMWPSLTRLGEKVAVLSFTYGFISFVMYALVHSHQLYIP